MIIRNLFKFSFIWNFHNKKYVVLSLTSFGTLKYDCVIKTTEIFNFLTLINNLFTILLSFLLLCISATMSSKTLKFFGFYLDCILQCFYKYYSYYSNI